MKPSNNPPNRLAQDEQRIRVTVDLLCSGGLDLVDLELIASRFLSQELERPVDGLHMSAFQGIKPDRREAIIDGLQDLKKLDPAAESSIADCLPVSLHDSEADYWFSAEAEDLLDDITTAIEEAADTVLDAAMNPHDAEMEEAVLSLHDPESDLIDCYS
jgi:hypothetical protein